MSVSLNHGDGVYRSPKLPTPSILNKLVVKIKTRVYKSWQRASGPNAQQKQGRSLKLMLKERPFPNSFEFDF